MHELLVITGRSRGVFEGPRDEETLTKTFSSVKLRGNRKRLGFIFKEELYLQLHTEKRCKQPVLHRGCLTLCISYIVLLVSGYDSKVLQVT